MENEKKKLVLITVALIIVASLGYYFLSDPGRRDDEEETTSPLLDLDPDEIVGEVTVYWFWGEGCPVCQEQKDEMEKWEGVEGIEVEKFDVYGDDENQQLFEDMTEAYDIESASLPTTFVGDEYWSGFTEEKNEEMEEKLVDCLTTEEESPHPEDRLDG